MFDSRKVQGLACGVAATLIAGGWQVATRHATTTTAIAPADLSILRYGIPALVLLPLAARTLRLARAVPLPVLAAMICGAGLPFGLVAMSGTRFAPSAHMGVLMAGASPLIAAGLAWVLWQERPSRWRGAGLALMALGVLLLGGKSFAGWSGDAWLGDSLFLVAATLWACFTLSFRRSGLTPWQAAALVNQCSAVMVLAWVALRGGSHLWQAPAATLAWQALWQGALGGVFGLWTYSVAIARLGAAPASAFGALVPVVSALGGWLWLDDRLGWIEGAAVLAAVAGVLLASGAVSRRADPA